MANCIVCGKDIPHTVSIKKDNVTYEVAICPDDFVKLPPQELLKRMKQKKESMREHDGK